MLLRRTEMPLWAELPVLVLVAFCVAVLVRTLLVQTFIIPSKSMEQTLLEGDRVLVDKVVYDIRDPLRGEVVVFRGTGKWAPAPGAADRQGFTARLRHTVGDLTGADRPGQREYIKRVIGLPGDRISCCDQQGRILVNDRAVDEPYVFENSSLSTPPGVCAARRFAEVLVAPGQLWVMGDHRSRSKDARCAGPVRIADVIGRAFVVLMPRDRFTPLSVPPVWREFDTDPAAAPQR